MLMSARIHLSWKKHTKNQESALMSNQLYSSPFSWQNKVYPPMLE